MSTDRCEIHSDTLQAKLTKKDAARIQAKLAERSQLQKQVASLQARLEDSERAVQRLRAGVTDVESTAATDAASSAFAASMAQVDDARRRAAE